MSENDSILSTEAADISSLIPFRDLLKPEPLILPGILHYAKRKGLEYLTLLKSDRVTAKSLFDDYLKLCQTQDIDMWEHANIWEAVHQVPEILSQLENFQTATCEECGFYNIPDRKLRIPEGCDVWAKGLYEAEIKKIKPHEKRAMQPARGKFTWTYRCEKCVQKTKEKTR